MLDAIAHRMNYKPMCAIGILLSLHTLVAGLAFMLGGDVRGTLLYKSVADSVNPQVFGAFMLLIGLITCVSFVYERKTFVDIVSMLQSFTWLLVTIIYFGHEQYFTGIVNGLSWALLCAYASYAYRNSYLWWSGSGTSQDTHP